MRPRDFWGEPRPWVEGERLWPRIETAASSQLFDLLRRASSRIASAMHRRIVEAKYERNGLLFVRSQRTSRSTTDSGYSLRWTTNGSRRLGPKRLSNSTEQTLWTYTARLSTGIGSRRTGRGFDEIGWDGQTSFVFIPPTYSRSAKL